MKSKLLKTESWPEGVRWPDEIVLDVGSSMPHDVYGCRHDYPGVLYVRHDVATDLVARTVDLVLKLASETAIACGDEQPTTQRDIGCQSAAKAIRALHDNPKLSAAIEKLRK
jgi:hypothetical protein